MRSKNEYTDFDHISLFLKNLNDNCVKAKFVFSVRNYQNYFYFIAKGKMNNNNNSFNLNNNINTNLLVF